MSMKSSTNYKLLNEVAQEMVETLKKKGEHYGDSWKSRGGSGAFMNIARKWDRLENQCSKIDYNVFKAILNDKAGDEGVRDSLLDLVGYGLLILTEMDSRNAQPLPVKNDSNCKNFGYDENNGDENEVK